jgi:hypothetical protein
MNYNMKIAVTAQYGSEDATSAEAGFAMSLL